MQDHILKVENLHVQLGKRMIIDNVNLNLKAGEIVGVIGPNGSGKTTLLNTLSGFLPVDTGSILYLENDITNLPAYKRAKLGINRGFQHVGVLKEMTLAENLMMPIEKADKLPWWWMFSKKLKRKVSKKIDKALAEVDLLAHKHSLAGVLSGGQLRLLEMQKLQLFGGELVLIDEPTAGVSPALRNVLASTIKSLSQDHGRGVVLVEHDLKFLFNLVDRVIVLVDGKKYMEGTPAEVQKDKRLQEVYFG